MSDDPGDLYTPDAGASDDLAADTTFDGMTGSDTIDAVLDGELGGLGTDYGAGDPTEAPPSDGHVDVNYEGVEFDAGQATVDTTGDGVADTAVQDHGYQVEYYADTTGDGMADELTILDPEGELISQEVVDPATGEWIDVTGQNQ